MEIQNSKSSTKLANTWCVWYRHDLNSWNLDGFTNICKLETYDDIWTFEKFCREEKRLLTEYIVVMKEGIDPIWEHPENRDGGSWSIKVDVSDTLKMFFDYLLLVCTDNVCLTDGIVNGISVSSKNTFNTIVQIWSKDKNISHINNLIPKIRDNKNIEVIYRVHNPEY